MTDGLMPERLLVIGVNEASLSRLHAVIEISDVGDAQVLDLGSTDGTWLNGNKVTKAALRGGDEVRVGELRLLLKHVASAIRPS